VLIMKAMRGFSILEVMIVVTVIGVVLTIGVPSFQTWLQNLQIRTGSEAIMSGLQITKNEAVRRNVNVVLTMDTTPGSQTGWRMNLESDVDGTPLQMRDGAEGSGNATAVLSPDGAFRVTFNGLGRVGKNIDGSDPLTQIDIDNPSIVNPVDRRKLRILITSGGGVRMCDPLAPVGDNRACP
jgi:type IV fimbrial biogenesis protein FimT